VTRPATQAQAKVALVTGAGSGIGRGIALKLAEAGARVVVSDINTTNGQETAHLITSAGGQAVFLRADVAVEDDVIRLVDFAVSRYERLDWACNNAGILGPQAPIFEYDTTQFDRVMAVNCRGVFLGLRYQLPVMLKQGSGAIVNIASECSVKGAASNCAYTASKHAVHGLTKNAALTVAKSGVRVNAVAPGMIHSAITDSLPPEMVALGQQIIPSGRWGQPSELADCVLWLLSDASRLLNGDMLMADEGWSIS
jgi:NAD(P)-dependent dehydrogenase (short-subunit alcohol dehydrogenase family)